MKQQKQVMLLGGLVVLALVVWYFNRTRPAVVAGNATTYQNYQLLTVDNPELHRDKLEAVQKTEYKPSGRNPFSEIAPPPPQDVAKQVAAARPFHRTPKTSSGASTSPARQREIFRLRHDSKRNCTPRLPFRRR